MDSPNILVKFVINSPVGKTGGSFRQVLAAAPANKIAPVRSFYVVDKWGNTYGYNPQRLIRMLGGRIIQVECEQKSPPYGHPRGSTTSGNF